MGTIYFYSLKLNLSVTTHLYLTIGWISLHLQPRITLIIKTTVKVNILWRSYILCYSEIVG